MPLPLLIPIVGLVAAKATATTVFSGLAVTAATVAVIKTTERVTDKVLDATIDKDKDDN